MVDRVYLTLASVGSKNAPTCPYESMRIYGTHILIERDLQDSNKLLLLSQPFNPKHHHINANNSGGNLSLHIKDDPSGGASSTNSGGAGTTFRHHHGHRNRKSNSLEKKKAITAASSASSHGNDDEDDASVSSESRSEGSSSSSAVLMPSQRSTLKQPNQNLGVKPNTLQEPSAPVQIITPSNNEEEAGVNTTKATRHAHRRSLSTSDHLHFAGKAGPPKLSAAAFQPADDLSDSEHDSPTVVPNGGGGALNSNNDLSSITERPQVGDNSSESSSDAEVMRQPIKSGIPPLPSKQSYSSTIPSKQIAQSQPSKSVAAKVLVTAAVSSSSPSSGPRVGKSNSPNYRPRRSSAPDLDSIVENVGEAEEAFHAMLSPPESGKSSTSTATPHFSDRTGGNDSTRSNRSRRHYRQLSAPVIVGGGADVEGDNPNAAGNFSVALNNGNPELKLPIDGLVVTRSGITSNATTPDRPFHKRSPPPSKLMNAQFQLDKTDDENSSSSKQSTPRTGSSPSGMFNSNELETLNVIGRGSAGIVTRALHVTALRIVAVKAVQKFDAQKRETTIAEIKALYKRMIPFAATPEEMEGEDSSCIVGFYDAFLSEGGATVNLVLEFMDGGSLQDLVDKKKAQGKTLPEDFISVACRRMLKGLCELYDERLLHRDMKPANVLVSRSGAIKLSDFGVSVAFGLGEMSNAKTFVGSLSYMAPERVQSTTANEGYSYASDLWALGLIAYVCATGEYPFTKQYDEDGFWGMYQAVQEEIPALDPKKFSPDLIDFVAQCLRKDPSQRPTAQEHLNHPFVKKFLDRPDLARKAIADQLDPIDQTQAQTELGSLLMLAAKIHIRNATRNQHTLPRFTITKVKNLAQQVGAEFKDGKELEEYVDQVNSKILSNSLSPSQYSAAISPTSMSQDSFSPAMIETSTLNNSLWRRNDLSLNTTM